jgi:hypothetical protein
MCESSDGLICKLNKLQVRLLQSERPLYAMKKRIICETNMTFTCKTCKIINGCLLVIRME